MKRPTDNTPAPQGPSRARLVRWLAEWELFKALTPENDETVAHPAAPLLSLSPPNETPVQPGDIRLLHPGIEPNALRYVVVAANEGVNEWLVVPFGLLNEPATPGEVLTGRSTPALRVLCPWNRLSISTIMLQRCWLVDRATDAEVAWCRSGLPADRTGPPLRHPLDPRWDYLEMESVFRQRVSSGTRRQVAYDITPSDLLKAAEDNAPYGDEEDESDDR